MGAITKPPILGIRWRHRSSARRGVRLRLADPRRPPGASARVARGGSRGPGEWAQVGECSGKVGVECVFL